MADNFTQRNCSMLIGVTLVLCLILTTSARLVLGFITWESNVSRYLTLDCLNCTLISWTGVQCLAPAFPSTKLSLSLTLSPQCPLDTLTPDLPQVQRFPYAQGHRPQHFYLESLAPPSVALILTFQGQTLEHLKVQKAVFKQHMASKFCNMAITGLRNQNYYIDE